jgi:hypothetical protein
VAALHLDLIMASDGYTLTQDHATLAKIAPTRPGQRSASPARQ